MFNISCPCGININIALCSSAYWRRSYLLLFSNGQNSGRFIRDGLNGGNIHFTNLKLDGTIKHA